VSASKPTPEATPLSERYWAACAEDRLLIQRCEACGLAVFFPRRWCPGCGSPRLADEAASGAGPIYSFSVVAQAAIESYAHDVPYVVALVELAEGPRIMANVIGCDPSDVRVGAPVTVAFEERANGIKVPQFELDPKETDGAG
jgi:uncharacterized OB-fold protein